MYTPNRCSVHSSQSKVVLAVDFTHSLNTNIEQAKFCVVVGSVIGRM